MGELLVEEQEDRCGKSYNASDDLAIEANEVGERNQQEEHDQAPGSDFGRESHCHSPFDGWLFAAI
jgi:hypothetical protein